MEEFWLKQAGLVRKRYNLACWLGYFLPCFLVFSLLVSIVLLWLRLAGRDLTLFFPVTCCLAVLLGIVVFKFSKKSFLSLSDALIEIESKNRLDSKLSSAYAGVGEYPEAIDSLMGDRVTWRKTALLTPAAFSCLAYILAYNYPVQTAYSLVTPASQLPEAVKEAEALIEEIKETEVADEEDLNNMLEQLEQLKQMEPQEWYEQNSLEALDNLSDKLEQSSKELFSKLQGLESYVEDSQLSQSEAESLEKSLESLAEGEMKMSPELRQELSESFKLDENKLSAEQQKKLRKMLKEKKDKLGQALGEKSSSSGKNGEQAGDSQEGESSQTCDSPGQSGSGEGQCSAPQPGDSEGEGNSEEQGDTPGPGRGGESAPLKLEEKSPKITSKISEKLNSLSDLPELDEFQTENLANPDESSVSPEGKESSFSPSASSFGGRAANLSEFTPGEAKILRKYFK